jgi:hypothetical protein
VPNYRDNHLAARALVDALLTNDRTAAAKHGITDRTLRRYREALETDPELSALFRVMRDAALTSSWTQELDRSLTELMAEVRARIPKLPQSIEGFERVVDAIRALGEIAVAREVLGATGQQDAAAATSGASQHASGHDLN